MTPKTGYFERTKHGERIVLTPKSPRRRSSSHTYERPIRDFESDEREQNLISQVSALQTRLSFAERNEWQLRQQHQVLVNEHGHCRNTRAQLEAQVREVHRLENLLDDEEDKRERLKAKHDKLEEKIRLLKRSVVHEDYRGVYEEKCQEVEVLRLRLAERDERLAEKFEQLRSIDARIADRDERLAEKAEQLRSADARLADKNRIILTLKTYLEQNGFRVQI